jgi:hypothetical protein
VHTIFSFPIIPFLIRLPLTQENGVKPEYALADVGKEQAKAAG